MLGRVQSAVCMGDYFCQCVCQCVGGGVCVCSRCCLGVEDEGSHCNQCACVFGGEGWGTVVGR